jgi:RNA polymerase sigma factor (sigma-70 family)
MATVPSVTSRPSNSGMGFRTTHWSVVLAARKDDAQAGREALASLCSAYWSPLYAFIRRQGASPPEAEDLTQEFFYQLIERHSLGHVERAGGKFRSFLLVCLKNFLTNQRERANAQRRGGGKTVVSLDAVEAERRYPIETTESLTPEKAYEQRWVFAVLERTLDELRRAYAQEKKSDLFEKLQGFLPCGKGMVSRAELAAEREVSVGAIDVSIHRLRQRFGTLLQEQVAQTVSSEDEIEGELRYLMSVLST